MYILIAFIIVFALYCTFFVSTPADVVEDYINSINNLDFNTTFSCINPVHERAYKAVGNILTGLLGINLYDLVAIMPILPALVEYCGENFEYPYFHINIISVEIAGNRMDKFSDKIYMKIDGIGNILGDEAKVYAEVVEMNSGMSENIIFSLKQFRHYGWRIMDIEP